MQVVTPHSKLYDVKSQCLNPTGIYLFRSEILQEMGLKDSSIWCGMQTIYVPEDGNPEEQEHDTAKQKPTVCTGQVHKGMAHVHEPPTHVMCQEKMPASHSVASSQELGSADPGS